MISLIVDPMDITKLAHPNGDGVEPYSRYSYHMMNIEIPIEIIANPIWIVPSQPITPILKPKRNHSHHS
jgi:hypothetical protein